jgi:hypothetical protein
MGPRMGPQDERESFWGPHSGGQHGAVEELELASGG